MPDLIAQSPLAGKTVSHGAARLAELPLAPLHLLAPWPGREGAFSAALQAAHGVAFPAPGTSVRAGEVELRWAGLAQAYLLGAAPDPGLSAEGAVTDVSDVHTRLFLAGEARADVLARLVPLDLRAARFPPGRVARTLLGHIPVHLTATGSGIEIAVMRSFARTAFHEIETAMRGVAARAALAP